MPNRGNLRKTDRGIWEAYNGSNWVPMNQFYAPDPNNRYVTNQRQAISDIQAALYAMGVNRVHGTSPQNYRFFIGEDEYDPDEEGYVTFSQPEEINLDTCLLYTSDAADE